MWVLVQSLTLFYVMFLGMSISCSKKAGMQSQQVVGMELCLLTESVAVFVSRVSSKALIP
jgi:hypothetical protein